MTWDDPSNTVDYDDCLCVEERPLALKVVINGRVEWIPKSQIVEDSEVQEEGDRGTLVITEWLAIKKGLE